MFKYVQMSWDESDKNLLFFGSLTDRDSGNGRTGKKRIWDKTGKNPGFHRNGPRRWICSYSWKSFINQAFSWKAHPNLLPIGISPNNF